MINELCRCLQRSLGKCTSFNHLKQIHALSVTLGILPNFQSLACKLFETYKNYGKLQEAQNIFIRIENPDIDSWTSLINLYLHFNLPSKSLSVFSMFIQTGFQPDSFLVILTSSFSHKSCQQVWTIHPPSIRTTFTFHSVFTRICQRNNEDTWSYLCK